MPGWPLLFPALQTPAAFAVRLALLAHGIFLASLLGAAEPMAQSASADTQTTIDFDRQIAPLLASRCSACHGPAGGEGGLKLVDLDTAMLPLDSGSVAIVPGKPEESELLRRVTSDDPGMRMPPKGEPLSEQQVDVLTQWIREGAHWPPHWAYRPLNAVELPQAPAEWSERALSSVDLFVLDALQRRRLAPSPMADKRTLIRRVTFDLTGLPPTPAEVDAFLTDDAPDAYERLVDRLLASPRYGERWARHWMDLVHFAETHGNDQDRPREHAWPYRDYLIRSLNEDEPFDLFAQQQIAGDALFPSDPDAIVATGLLAAGPWDESSLRDIRDDTIDREIARYLDRDDIVTTVISTFLSTTVHCARCHDHKFDPIGQHEYYALQSVFAGIGKGNRRYDARPADAVKRQALEQLSRRLQQIDDSDLSSFALVLDDLRSLDSSYSAIDVQNAGDNPSLKRLHAELADWQQQLAADEPVWEIAELQQFHATDGTQLERQDDGSLYASGERPDKDVYHLALRTNLKRITGLKLDVLADERLPAHGPGRQDNGNLHLNEIRVFVAPVAQPTQRRTLRLQNPRADFNQDGWSIDMAIDENFSTAWGVFPEVGKSHWASFELAEPLINDGEVELTVELHQVHGRGHLIGRPRLSLTSHDLPLPEEVDGLPSELRNIMQIDEQNREIAQRGQLARYYLSQQLQQHISALPPQRTVYCGSNQFVPDGSFKPDAVPRKVHVLERGDVSKPLAEAQPAALSFLSQLPPTLDIADLQNEGQRRAALARWITHPQNALFWRSAANRIWQHHFGVGLVDTPNDFGRLGSAPSHPELLDWLALELQRSGGSLKHLHRLIVTSAAYQQTSEHIGDGMLRDADNRYLWRMNRRRLDAESIRDAVLQISGQLDLTMGGPSARQFVQTAGIHVTPNVDYVGFDPADPANHRRSVYRFIFRTLPDPFMETMDCPDSSQLTPVRNSSITALQALAMLNDNILVHQSQVAAHRFSQRHSDVADQVRQLYRHVLLREPTADEQRWLQQFVEQYGLANACRVLLNSNEFVFVD